MTALCAPWCLPTDIPPAMSRQLPESSDVTAAIAQASGILYALSGRRWRGSSTKTDYALHVGCGCDQRLPSYADALRIGFDSTTLEVNDWSQRWIALRLPDYPVTSVGALSRAGVAIDLSTVAIEGNRDLYLLPLDRQWPVGDYLITYDFGVPPPDEARHAAGVLAGELALAAAGCECRLPARVTSIVRQGVTIAMLDPLDFLKDGRTGIFEVDLFLAAVNPRSLADRPRVLSPDTLTPRQPRSLA